MPRDETQTFFTYVGCRTTRERNARGKGLNVYRMDAETGRWDHIQLVPGVVNPSFLAFDNTRQVLFAVHGDGSEASAFRIDPATGKLAPINRQSTRGGIRSISPSIHPTVFSSYPIT